ncbi:RNA-directed DNA polymerase from mobile element jockey [Araneus ventricosus]|uniref:RNA-directed DNA polymerase from mobile element jockey n=1 Tax=Araneus ventricosus TaxID=182803 RepID=A0A4Y2UMS7_ARAVE|nr:RNA-directed DNA polymerase from mobile element jockey [Araneus ventricosus]GBO14338.1 RNA-directed DNA polymerase from mobile element jockey [Araneus ventricosus]
MNQSHSDTYTASSVAQDNQGRVQDLGRGSCPINRLQSPTSRDRLKNLRILQCNINGISLTASRIKLDQILELADAHQVSVSALQETKLQAKHLLKVKGYNIVRQDRPSSGGGLVFLIRDVYYQKIPNPDPQNICLESLGVRILSRNQNVNIINLYHTPNNQRFNVEEFENYFGESTVILGDLNAKHATWGCATTNARGQELEDLANDKGFLFLNDGTHTYRSLSYNTTDVLDLTLISPDIFPYSSWRVLDHIGSDHSPILTEINFKIRTLRTTNLSWNFGKANWNNFESILNERLSQSPLTEDLEREWACFKDSIFIAAKRTIPRGKDIIRSYIDIKRRRWEQLCSNLDYKTPNSRLWKLAKALDRAQPQEENSNSITKSNGSLTIDDQEAAEELGKFYSNESRVTFGREDKKVGILDRNLVKTCCHVSTSNQVFSDYFTTSELMYAIQQMDNNKSPGPDGIHGKFLENIGPHGRERLLYIFNLSWKVGVLPKQWKTAVIIPVRKPNKEANSLGSYRPIALTCIPCKLMERIILRRITHHLMELNLIPEEQYGFRRGHSTIDQILYFAQSVRDAHNLKPTKHTISVFLDLTKAFDKVWKNKLLVKCHDEFNIRGRVLPWISNFLNDRSFRVKYQSGISSIYRSYQGIPQGSVLSPTLFSLFVAGMEKMVSSCNIGLFADDVVIWKNDKDVIKIENSLNENMVAIQSFAEVHKLNFNPAKSFTCIFTTNRHMFNLQPKIYLKGNLLETTKSPTYLGFTLDTEINCGKHIAKLVEKGRKRLQLLKFISGRDWGANSGTLRMTYTALIRPVLEYGYQVYQVASQTNLNKLEKVQLSAARIITGLRSCCPKAIVLYEADLQPLSMRIRTNSAKYIAKLQSLGSFNELRNLFFSGQATRD